MPLRKLESRSVVEAAKWSKLLLEAPGPSTIKERFDNLSNGSPFATDILVNGVTVGRGSLTIATGPIAEIGESAEGLIYVIESLGNTDFTLIGAPSNTVGLSFITTVIDELATNWYTIWGSTGTITVLGVRNTSIGYKALYSNTTGVHNTAVGAGALIANTTGNSNTASGINALRANTTGAQNTASGAYSLYNNTTGTNNTASGAFSLYNNTTGNDNVASGTYSLCNNTTGTNNICLGFNSGSYITGSNNVVIGSNNGSSIATLDNHIILSDGEGNIRAGVNNTGVFNVVGSLTVNGLQVNPNPSFLWSSQTANYTLVLADSKNGIAVDTPTPSSVTVPTDAAVDFPIGTSILITADGTGSLTISGDVGVVVRVPSGQTSVLRGQYSIATLIKRAANTWNLAGDLEAVV